MSRPTTATHDGAAGEPLLYRKDDTGRVFDERFDEGSLRAVRTVTYLAVAVIIGSFLTLTLVFFGEGIVTVEIPHMVAMGLAVVTGVLALGWANPVREKDIFSLPYAITVFGGLVFAYSLYRLIQVIYCANNPLEIGTTTFCEESLVWEIAGMIVTLVIAFGIVIIIAGTWNVREALRSAQRKRRARDKQSDETENEDDFLMPDFEVVSASGYRTPVDIRRLGNKGE